jgi:Melibiase
MKYSLALVVASTLAAGCGQDERLVVLGPGRVQIQARDDGTADLTDDGGRVFLRRASAEALVRTGGSESTISSTDCASDWEPLAAPPATASYFRELDGKRRRCLVDGLVLDWTLLTDPDHDVGVVLLRFENQSDAEVTLLRLTPLVSRAPEGGLFVGERLARERILDNGSDLAADVDVKLHYPDERRNAVVGAILPIESRGDVVSNWNEAIVDLDSGRSFIAGALGVEHAFPTFGSEVAEESPARAGSREGFAAFFADQQLAFDGKPLAPGESLESEPVYVDPLAPDAFTGLEHYADAVAAWQDFTVWTRRDGGRRVPNGWNSWSGSGSTGGLGTNIDENILSENLDVMAREFEPFGIDYFQIDDGYQSADGDWSARPDRFPSGMPALSQKIRDRGLLPGIWISAFSVALDSQLAAEHPDYLSQKEDRVLPGLLDPGANATTLDLSNDAAIDWLAQTMTRYRDEWGMRWIKLDFAYLAMPTRPRKNPRLTSIEAYKRGIRELRQVLGDDVFYLGIALMGVNYGVVDAMRVTLDTGPRWEEKSPFTLLGDGGNLKQSVKSGSRRYYLNDRVWITHDDLMFFRSDASDPSVTSTLDEAKTFASFIGLSSSIVKFGEDLRTLSPEQIDVWRKLLPIYPTGARPMDLFERMYPELYRLPIDGTLAGADAHWLVVGLLDWGRNWDFSADGAPLEMPDAGRSYDLDLAAWGLDPEKTYLAREFWSGDVLPDVRGHLHYDVPAHGHAVIALREETGHPQFLGENRHFTQGGTDLALERWDPAARSLELAFDVDAAPAGATPFEYVFDVHVPEGFAFSQAQAGSATISQEGSVLELRLTPQASTRYQATLFFD